MDQVPGELLHDLSAGDEKTVTAWWAGLSDLNRSEVAALCHARCAECFFGAVPEDPSASVPLVIGGRFLASDEAAGWAEWHAELFDYLLCNPELVIVQPPVMRTFHIG